MENRSRIVVYGNTQFLEALGSCLKSLPKLRAEYILEGETDAPRRIREISPDAIVLDTARANFEFAIPFLMANPGRMLIGVERATGKVVVLSSRQHTALMGNDLAFLIQKQIFFDPPFAKPASLPAWGNAVASAR